MPKNDPHLSISLDRSNKTYAPHQQVSGQVQFKDFPSKGIDYLSLELYVYGWTMCHKKPRGMKSALLGLGGSHTSTISPKSDSHYLVKIKQKINSGSTAYSGTVYPFSFKLEPLNPSQPLLDSYQGVHIQVNYEIAIDMKLSVTTTEPPISTTQKFYVNISGAGLPSLGAGDFSIAKMMQPVEFYITPQSVQAMAGMTLESLPKFNFEGKIASNNCDIDQPLQGYIQLKECEVDIKSIQVQLLRVESFYPDGTKELTKQCTEIQNIQVASGNVLTGFQIPVYFLFPRYFSCPTLTPQIVPTAKFSIEFQVNLIIILKSGYQITQNFPIRLFRKPIGSGLEKKSKKAVETLF